MEIVSLTNEKIKLWGKLHQIKYRKETGLFLVEGEHLIQEAEKAGLIETVLVKKDVMNPFVNQKEITVTSEILRKLSQTSSEPSLMAVCHLWQVPLKIGKRLILLDDVQDPGNVGTIIRTALSFGFDGVVLSANSVDPTNDKVIRSSQGAIFHIPVIQRDLHEVITECKAAGVMTLSTGLQNAIDLNNVEISKNVAIVLGNEGQGISKAIRDLSDQVVKIEMSAFESLNVAVACGILCYRFRKDV